MATPFTDEQLAAITAPLGPGVVVAGAGSGKTTVMAARVLWLVANHAVAPHEVLGLTFTNKAAAELADRLRRAMREWRGAAAGSPAPGGVEDWLPSDVELDLAVELDPVVLTYHAYAGTLLREHGLRLGLEPAATVLADATRFQLAERVLRAAVGPFPGLDRTPASLVPDVLALDGELNEHLVEPEQVVAHDDAVLTAIAAAPRLTSALRDVRGAAAARRDLLTLVRAYREAKRERLRVDFGDQMAGAARLAEQVPQVRRREREAHPVVLLDEYQDTSIAQKRLLLALFGDGHPVTAVGDPFQAIYGWRGASVANIEGFCAEFTVAGEPAPRFGLGQNNRSGGRLLSVANAISGPLRQAHPGVPSLQPQPGAADAGLTRVAVFESQAAELAFVADDIAARWRRGTPAQEIAVLVRVVSDIAPLHAALTQREVPVEVVGLGGLLELPAVADVVATLRVLDDPTANASMVRLLTGPRWRIGPRDLVLLARRAAALVADPTPAAGRSEDTRSDSTRSDDTGTPGPDDGRSADPDAALLAAVAGIDPAEVVSLAEALADPGRLPYSVAARERFTLLATELDVLRRHAGEPVDDLVHRVAHGQGLFVEVAAVPGARRANRTAALSAFLDVAGEFVDVDGDPSVTAFLAFLDAAQEHERGLDAAVPTTTDSVKLLTVHKAKGLEWPVVYVPDLTRGVFPSDRGRSTWITRGAVLPYALRGDAADFPPEPTWTAKGLKEYVAACRDRERLEERRLAYVALTRAKHEMVLTSHWWGATQKLQRGPSQYLLEVHEHLLAHPLDGRVEQWAEAPHEESNPGLTQAGEHAWPVELDATSLAARQQAAQRVRLAWASPSAALPSLTGADATLAAGWRADTELLLAELRRSVAPVREVQVPSTLTASQLVSMQADPQQFARHLVRPVPRPPAPAAHRGTAFHRWVEERFMRPALLDLDDLPSVDPELLDTELEQLQAAFLAGPYADRRPLAVEAPFEIVLGAHTVRGRIDAVYAADAVSAADAAGSTGVGGSAGASTRYEVVDWKTGRRDADPLQLAVYRAAWAQLSGAPIEAVDAVFYVVRTGQIQRFPDLPEAAELAEQTRRLLDPA